MGKVKYLFWLWVMLSLLTACGIQKEETTEDYLSKAKTGEMNLQYANEYRVDYYGDCSMVTIGEDEQYFLFPKGESVPENLPAGITVIETPVDHVYMAASAAMDLVRELNSLDHVSFTGTDIENWTIPDVITAMQEGQIRYGGKYSAPDYEGILNDGCELAVESTMIYHSPDVKEQLELMDIPVLVERSSYEKEPLGRVEWIRLYGLLFDKNSEAELFMKDCEARYNRVKDACKTLDHRPTFCIFYIAANGNVIVKKPGDYVIKMMEEAGGEYVLKNIDGVDDNSLSTMNMQMETFYAYASTADYLFYNSTIVGDVSSISDLLNKNELLGEFKSVQSQNVYCVHQNMFQQTTAVSDMMEDFYKVLAENSHDTVYLSHLE